jgi:hypothetical protein
VFEAYSWRVLWLACAAVAGALALVVGAFHTAHRAKGMREVRHARLGGPRDEQADSPSSSSAAAWSLSTLSLSPPPSPARCVSLSSRARVRAKRSAAPKREAGLSALCFLPVVRVLPTLPTGVSLLRLLSRDGRGAPAGRSSVRGRRLTSPSWSRGGYSAPKDRSPRLLPPRRDVTHSPPTRNV